jgi:hypothetical protein
VGVGRSTVVLAATRTQRLKPAPREQQEKIWLAK